jgi:hypothetical protein
MGKWGSMVVGLTDACRPRAPAVGAEAPELRGVAAVVPALPAAGVAGPAVADAGHLPVQDKPVLQQPAVVGSTVAFCFYLVIIV